MYIWGIVTDDDMIIGSVLFGQVVILT